MKTDTSHFPRTIVWVTLFILTVLLSFPFFYYYKFSTINSDFLRDSRLRISKFGMDLKLYLEQSSLSQESAADSLRTIPVPSGSTILLYDREANLLFKRESPGYTEFQEETRSYTAARKFLSVFRKKTAKSGMIPIQTIRTALVNKALQGNRSTDALLKTDRIGDRTLFIAFPIHSYPGHGKNIEGALLVEYKDPSLSSLLQKHRGQLAVTGLLFGLLLTGYAVYILVALVFPLKKLLKNLISVSSRTDYLLTDQDRIKKNSEIGEFTRQLDSVSGLLKQSERETEQYASELRHIIRNPLTNITIALEGLLIGRNTPQNRSFSDIIQNNLTRIDRYLESYPFFLTNADVYVESLNSNRFMHELIRNYQPLAQQKKIRLLLSEPDTPVIWKGFPTYLNYVCEQVFTNAVDFSPENSSIEWTISAAGKKIRISIADQGPGIPAGKEQELFNRYVSFRNQTDKTHTGTGLFLAKTVLHKIGGSITAENRPTGGALFVITLPTEI